MSLPHPTDAGGAFRQSGGSKHANRALPDVVELANRWREGVLLLRCWTAIKLGVDRESLAERAKTDPMAFAYVPAV
jgi:hypothetical protein